MGWWDGGGVAKRGYTSNATSQVSSSAASKAAARLAWGSPRSSRWRVRSGSSVAGSHASSSPSSPSISLRLLLRVAFSGAGASRGGCTGVGLLPNTDLPYMHVQNVEGSCPCGQWGPWELTVWTGWAYGMLWRTAVSTSTSMLDGAGWVVEAHVLLEIMNLRRSLRCSRTCMGGSVVMSNHPRARAGAVAAERNLLRVPWLCVAGYVEWQCTSSPPPRRCHAMSACTGV